MLPPSGLLLAYIFLVLIDDCDVQCPYTVESAPHRFISSTIAAGLTVISTQAGTKPLLTAFRTDRMFDQAVQ